MITRFVLGAVLIATSPDGQTAESLQVRAHVSTAGPYGESWVLNLAPDGKITVDIHYMLPPFGKMSGEFLASPELIAALRRTIESEKFLGLPTDLWPSPISLHAPDLRLTVTSGQVVHEVRLYDPAQFKDDVRARRFMKVWNQVFELVPLRPTW